jgi:hypothetical protein
MLGGHVGQLVLGDLKLGDFLAELLALLDIGQGPVIGPLGRSQGLGRHLDAALIEKMQHVVKAPVPRRSGFPAARARP